MALLSQWIETGGMGLGHNGILKRKILNHSPSLEADDKATNSAAMVEYVIHVFFLDPQDTALPPKRYTHPLVEE